jgi:hypothetical protein
MRMTAIVSTVFVLAAVAFGRPAASAGTIGEARVGFSAERVLVIDGRRFAGPMWQMPGVQRHEQKFPAMTSVVLLFAHRKYGDILLPSLHVAVPFALPKVFALLDEPGLLHRPIGRKDIDGIAVTGYAVDVAAPEGRAQGSLWLSRDGIPMRIDAMLRAPGGKVTTLHWELHHVRIGPQPASLFAVPHGYTLLPAEAVAPLLGLRLPPAARQVAR